LRNEETTLDSELEEESSLPLFAKDKTLGWLLAIGGFIAWIASGALILDRLKIYENPSAVASCDVNALLSCGQVMRTAEASIFGFPNPFIGLAGFAVLITVGVVLIAGASLPRWFWIGVQTGMTLGMALVSWFWFTALYTIGILCPYCMVVWAMMIPMFLWITARNILSGVIPSPVGLQRIVSVWTNPAVIGVYLVVIASIVYRFGAFIFGGLS
jgi:uncharacterized membrane protein